MCVCSSVGRLARGLQEGLQRLRHYASGAWKKHTTTNASGDWWHWRGKRAVRTNSNTSGSWEEATPRRVKWVKRKKANPATLEWVQRKVDVSDATKRRLADFFDQAECPP